MVKTAALAAVLVSACAAPAAMPRPARVAAVMAVGEQPPASPALPPPPPPPSPSPPDGARALGVPLIAQVLNLSCEAASLEMALAHEGVNVDQRVLLARMHPDYSRPALQSGRVISWSDPYDHFVGDPAGHEYDHTGYGVYYPVVARVAEASGGEVLWAGTGISWDGLESFLESGHPAVVWIAYDGSAYRQDGPVYDYRATDGRTVPYAPGFEHTVVAVAVTQDAVVVDNPRWGRRDRLSRGEFLAAIAPFGGMAVVLS